MSAKALIVNLARHYVIPMGKELVSTFEAEYSHERLIDPRVAASIMGSFLRYDMQGVEAPFVVLPAFNRFLEVCRQLFCAHEVKESGVGVEAGYDDLAV